LKNEIYGLSPEDVEIGEEEVRNEHDFYVLNLNNNKLIQGRFIITKYKIVFVPYEKEIHTNEFYK
jgi:hypothetical protein